MIIQTLRFLVLILCLSPWWAVAGAAVKPPKINPSTLVNTSSPLAPFGELPYNQGPCLHAPCSLSLATEQKQLPSILSEQDKYIYQIIFNAQKNGEWKRADRAIQEIRQPILIGHILYQRYMHPRLYRSSFKELKNWLSRYADHPGNLAVRKLAIKRRPSKNTSIPRLIHPVPKDLRTSPPSPNFRPPSLSAHSKRIYKKVRSMVQSGYITRALEYVQQLRKTQKLKSYGYALSLGAIARGYYRYHKWEKSITMARYLDSLPLSSSYALDAYWWAGLAAWRQENYTESAEFFDKYVTSSQQSSEAKARGYYWSALASLMAGYPRHASPRLQKSCQESLEFYGYLACRTLSLKNPNHNKSSLPLVSDRPWTRTLSLPPVRRALALMEVGEIKKAISELRPLTSRYVAPSILKSIIRLAHIAHLPYISYLAAKSLFQVTGNAYLKALFPQPLWTPNGGYHIDRALIYAIIRQESHFNPFAKSRRQARGLMQIIPSTARFISKYQLKQRHSQNLYAPTVNIQLGQSYIRWLLSTPSIEGNLLKTLIAYNGGPGNMLTWKKRIADTIHPLLYIESLPPRETRKYVRHVLRNVWIYRDLMEQQPSSLRDILKSHWPLYAPQDQTQKHNNHSQASNQTLPKK